MDRGEGCDSCQWCAVGRLGFKEGGRCVLGADVRQVLMEKNSLALRMETVCNTIYRVGRLCL